MAVFAGFLVLGGVNALKHNSVAVSFIDLPVVN